MSFYNFLVSHIPARSIDEIVHTIADITKGDGYTEIKVTVHNGGEFTIFTDRNEVLGSWRGEWLHRSYLTLEAALHDAFHFFRGSCPRKKPSREEIELFIEIAKDAS
nr:MAG TPA: hypothetical protein [Caudoviricetes sp.]